MYLHTSGLRLFHLKNVYIVWTRLHFLIFFVASSPRYSGPSLMSKIILNRAAVVSWWLLSLVLILQVSPLAFLLYFWCYHYTPVRHLERPEPPRDFQELVSPFFLFWQASGETRTSKGFPGTGLSIYSFLCCFHLPTGRLLGRPVSPRDFQKLASLLYFRCCHYPPGRHLERPEPPRDFQELVSPFFFSVLFSPSIWQASWEASLPKGFPETDLPLVFLVFVIILLAGTWRDLNLQGISRNWFLHFSFLCCFHLPSGRLLGRPVSPRDFQKLTSL